MTGPRFKQKIKENPQWFLEEALGVLSWEKMWELINAVLNNRRVICAGCVSSSKTFTTACLIIAWLYYNGRPSRALTFAPTMRQVAMNVWGYMPVIFENSKMPLPGYLTKNKYVINHDWLAMGFATDNPQNVKGIHGKNDLLIFDDGQGIAPDMFKGLELAMANGKAHSLILCNKDTDSGEVYDAYHSKSNLYTHVDISADDTPNVKTGQIIIDGMITKEQKEEWIKTFGEDDDFVRVFVFNKFPRRSAKSLIPEDWVDMAMKREVELKGDMVLGLDVAWTGKDTSPLTPMKGRKIFKAEVVSKFDPTEVGNWTIDWMKKLNASEVFVDVIGIGAGAYSTILHAPGNWKATPVNVSESVKPENVVDYFLDKDYEFKNLRALLWWCMWWSLNPSNPDCISLPKDLKLKEELIAVRWGYTTQREIIIEEKEKTKARLKRSPDLADSACLANYGMMLRMKRKSERFLTVGDLTDFD